MSSCRPAIASPAAPTVSLKELADEPLVLLGSPAEPRLLPVDLLRPRVCSRASPMRRRPSRWCAAWSPTATAIRSCIRGRVSEQALDGMRLVYRPVTEKIRPTRLGIARRKDARPRRMATAFAGVLQGIPDRRQSDDAEAAACACRGELRVAR